MKAVLSPNTLASTVAAAPLKAPCPSAYSGKLGVVSSGCQFGSAVVAGLPSAPASWMAVMGRQPL